MAVPPISVEGAELFRSLIDHHLRFTLAKRRIQLSKADWYRATAMVVRDMLVEKMLATEARVERRNAKKVYYLSLEFLIGRSLENNLFNLGMIDVCREYLAECGFDLQLLFDYEPDAALGNGGLGRLRGFFLGFPPRPAIFPAMAMASTTSTASSARKFATAIRSRVPTPGSARLRHGWSSGP